MTPPETRPSLMVRLKGERNEFAWAEFVSAYEPFLQRLIRRQGVPARHVPDVCQQVLAAVARSVESWQDDGDPASFRRWLNRVARHAVLKFMARERRQAGGQGGTDVQEDVICLIGYEIHAMSHLPGGRFLAACADSGVLLLDTHTAQFEVLGRHPTRAVPGYFGTGTMVSAQALSRDGCLFATGSHEDRPTIRVWDLTTGRQVHKLQHPAGHYVHGLAFSPDGTQLVSGVNWDEDGQGAVCLWQLAPRIESDAGYRD